MTDDKTCDAIFKFETYKQREMFITWLCEHGEQDYWEWMQYRDDPEKDTVDFDYWEQTGEFAGRVDSSEEAIILCKNTIKQ